MRRPATAGMILVTLACCASCDMHSGAVRAFGTIEMDEVDVASRVGGRLVRLRVDEGDSVKAGDTLAVLEQGEIVADLASSAAQADRAAAQLRDLKQGPRPAEIGAARAALDAATAQARLTASDLERTQKLFDENVLAQADLDRARSTHDTAEAQRRNLAEQLKLLEAGYRREQVAAAAQAEQAAKAGVTAARMRASELTLVAPITGVVLLRNYTRGELVPAGSPVVTLGDPERLWIRCYVAAPDLPRVRLGDPAEIRVTGAKRPAEGHVIEIASRAEFTPRAALTEEERANLVFGVKILIDPTAGVLKPGLPAEARILDGGAARASRAEASGR